MSTAPTVIRFGTASSDDSAAVGGKGANLGRLSAAGFPVPPGFSITTQAYRDVVGQVAGTEISGLTAQIEHSSPGQLEQVTAKIRELITSVEIPAPLRESITEAYRTLGADSFVAVRSSGTAEDLAEASFAGQHDTFLDVQGSEALLDAVRRCWASMWTARATSYRHSRGFDHAEATIAVVVQTMVESEVSGVMFTANPVTGSTEETVINASFGLGEAIVAGIVTPDQYVVRPDLRRIRDRFVARKTVRIVRNAETSQGTVRLDIDEADQDRPALSDQQILELTDLGRQVTEHYGRFPQDIEWGFADDAFHLLQSRPVTGVNLSWDDHVDAWRGVVDDEDDIWTRAWSDEQWTGAIGPLTFAHRHWMMDCALKRCAELWNEPRLAEVRMFRYHRAEAYYNATADKLLVGATCLQMFRPSQVQVNMPPSWRDEVLAAPFSYLDYLKLLARTRLVGGFGNAVYGWFTDNRTFMADKLAVANGRSRAELRELSDRELLEHLEEVRDVECEYVIRLWTPYYVYARDTALGFVQLVSQWYDGDNPMALAELLTGTPERTSTGSENLDLWRLSERIRNTPSLRQVFEEHDGPSFFVALDGSAEGREFAAEYREFLTKHGHRGHADRDMWYARRSDDPGIDFRMVKSLLSSPDSIDPEARERELAERREVVAADVIANLARKPFGALRVEAFKLLYAYVQKFMIFRDDERYWVDRTTCSIKRAFEELGRRLADRGLLETTLDIHFLAPDEVFELAAGRADLPLVRAKIAGRRHDFDKFLAREADLPLYLFRGQPFAEGSDVEAVDGVLSGVATSGGVVTGTARVVKTVDGIGSVRHGDILVTNATDPGWTPVFMVISGLVLETGGMLAHGSMLSREYGLPAVQIPDVMKLIADGATITVDGNRGTVEIHDDEAAVADETEPA